MPSSPHERTRGSVALEVARKRSRTSSLDTGNVHNASIDMISKMKSSSSTSTSQSHINQQLAIEVSNLKTELSKIQSIRNLDRIKAENMEKRLKRHIVSLEEDVSESSALSEAIRIESEQSLEEMSSARREASIEAREWQERYMVLAEGGVGGSGSGNSSHAEQLQEELEVANKKNELLHQKVQSMEEEINTLQSSISNISSTQTRGDGDHEDEDYDDSSTFSFSPMKRKRTDTVKSPSCRAPPAVLSELNRTRVQLADSERTNRQLTRKIEELQSEANQVVTYRERAQNAESKIDNLEREMKVIRREKETLRIVETRWSEFRKELAKHNFMKEIPGSVGFQRSDGKFDNENAPPEIASVLRQFRLLRAKVSELEDAKDTNDSKLGVLQRRVQTLEKQIEENDNETRALNEEKTKLTDQARQAEQDLRTIQAQERVWKRESSSMRELLDTYKQMEQNVSVGKKEDLKHVISSSPKSPSGKGGDATTNGLQLSLTSAKDEIEILKKQFTTAKEEKDKLEKDSEALKEEHARVRKKFEQLRDALFKEREKAEKAETRAFDAEVLAGKGSFNLEKARVLHLENNPTSIALREKYEKVIKALKEELKATESLIADPSGKGHAKVKGQMSKLDAQKVTKRLKEKFRSQIGHFREGVYLLTGYKIDMVADVERPIFKVRSMYAESESDVLEFVWPELEEGTAPDTLDILSTKMAKILSKEPCFAYIEKHKSLPAFMASVCLSLFEKQTIMM